MNNKESPSNPKENHEGKTTLESYWSDSLLGFKEKINNILSRRETVNEGRDYEETEKEIARLERQEKVLDRAILAIGLSAALLFIGAAGSSYYFQLPQRYEYYSTRWKVKKKSDQSGQNVYEHEDKETTDTLNYLSGVQELPIEEQRKLAFSNILNTLHDRKITLPEDIDFEDEQTTKQWLQKAIKENRLGGQFAHINWDEEKWWKHWLHNKFPENKKLYNAFWRIETETGNPKIRWIIDTAWINKNGSRAHYKADENTVYIAPLAVLADNPDFAISDFLAEASHSKQYNEKYLPTRTQVLQDEENTLKLSKEKNLPPDQIENQTKYKKRGTVEYEAHQVIEPELKKEFYNIADPKNKKDN